MFFFWFFFLLLALWSITKSICSHSKTSTTRYTLLNNRNGGTKITHDHRYPWHFKMSQWPVDHVTFMIMIEWTIVERFCSLPFVKITLYFFKFLVSRLIFHFLFLVLIFGLKVMLSFYLFIFYNLAIIVMCFLLYGLENLLFKKLYVFGMQIFLRFVGTTIYENMCKFWCVIFLVDLFVISSFSYILLYHSCCLNVVCWYN